MRQVDVVGLGLEHGVRGDDDVELCQLPGLDVAAGLGALVEEDPEVLAAQMLLDLFNPLKGKILKLINLENIFELVHLPDRKLTLVKR